MSTPSSSTSTTYLVLHIDGYSPVFYQHNLPGSPRWQVLHPLLSVSAPLTWFSLLMGTPSSSISLSTTYLVIHTDRYSLLFYHHHLCGSPCWQVLPPLLSGLVTCLSTLRVLPPLLPAPLALFSMLMGTPSSSISTTYLVLHADGYSLLFYQHHLPGSPHWCVLPLLPAPLTWFSTLTGTPSSSISFSTTYLVLHIDRYSLLFYQF